MEKILATATVLIIVTFSSCTAIVNYDDNKALKMMVGNGADPVAARCAVKGPDSKVCVLYACKMEK